MKTNKIRYRFLSIRTLLLACLFVAGIPAASFAVNTAPAFVLPSPQSFAVCQNSGAHNFSTLLNVNDPDLGQTLTWSVVPPLAAHGTVTPGTTTAPAAPGASVSGWVYTPNAGYSGPDQISITVNDGNGGNAIMIINITINALPGTITGPATVCRTQTIQLQDPNGPGTWSSSNPATATVGLNSGVVTGAGNTNGGAQNVTITYTLSNTGCVTSKVIAVNPLSVITGVSDLCAFGQTSAHVHDGTFGGVWSSTNAPVATTGVSNDAIITSQAAGPATVSYSLPNGCVATASFTVNPLPAGVMAASTAVCVGSTIALTDQTAGGTWASSNAGQATVDQSGIVGGVSAGSPSISYSIIATGCYSTQTITVNALPVVPSNTNVCLGSPNTTLTGNPTGGTWSSSSTSFAITPGGQVFPFSAGTGIVTYTLGTGCTATGSVTVNPTPDPITGNTTFCQNGSTTLSDATAGGTWSSDNVNVANIDMNSGVITSTQAGTANITYSFPTGCIAVTVVTVNAITPITGNTSLCKFSTTTLSDATVGGTWSSSNMNATIDATSGVVTGVDAGTTTITYALPSGCFATRTETVDSLPLLSGGSVCVGGVIALAHSPAGGPVGVRGTWSSSDPSVATINTNSFLGRVHGVDSGFTIITLTMPLTGCSASNTVVVNPIQPIVGAAPICAGNTLQLSDATTGGTWSSDNTTVANVDANGLVTSASAGNVNITYATTAGCSSSVNITVNPLPANISGTFNVCQGQTTAYFDATPNGAWTSANTTIATVNNSGVVTGVNGGTSTISYTLNTGCYATAPITVNPIGTISGIPFACIGTTTQLSETEPNGGWFTTSPHASVTPVTGVVTGVSNGVATITYQINATGCYATYNVTIGSLPAITGPSNVCAGSTIQLADLVPGGTWSSDNNSAATVNNSGIVTGVAAGNPNIIYAVAPGCSTSKSITVDPLPVLSTGSVCEDGILVISHTPAGGTWSSSNSSVATINENSNLGRVHAVSPGNVTITYTTPAGCVGTTTVQVNPNPAAIVGDRFVCPGISTTLSDATPGGTWSSSNSNVATIGANSGTATGVATGFDFIRYTLPTGCRATAFFQVTNNLPGITGSSTVCIGQTVTLSDNATGGTWTSADPTVAQANPTTGEVTGISSGTAIITYSLGGTCRRIRSEVVDALSPIIGNTVICEHATTSLSDTTFGGTWSSANANIATVDQNTGLVTGVAGGSTTISYILPTGCTATTSLTVNFVPTAIAGLVGSGVCVGSSTTLSNGVPNGTWSSSDNTIASIDPTSGVVFGLMTGTVTITYVVPSGCTPATIQFVVNPLPNLTSATTMSICNNTLVNYQPTSDLDPNTVFQWSRDAVTGISNAAATGAGNPSASPATEVLNNTTPDPINVNYVYSMYVNGTTCVSTATVVVTVNPTLDLFYPLSNGTICDSNTFAYTDSSISQNVTYTWDRDTIAGNPTVTGTGNISEMLVNTTTEPVLVTYTVTLTANGCSDMRLVTVTVNPSPVLVSPVTIPAICDGNVFTFNANSSTSAVTGYSWHRDAQFGNAVADGTGSLISEVLVNNTHAPVNVIYTDTMFIGTCFHTQTIAVVVNPSPTLDVLAGNPICDSVLFTYVPASPATEGTVTYTWVRPYLPGIGLLAGSGTGSISETLVNTTNIDVTVGYDYTLTSDLGCTNTQTVTEIVHPRPSLSSATGPFTICSGTPFNYAPTGYVAGTSFAWHRPHVAGISPNTGAGNGGINEVLIDSTLLPKTVVYTYVLTANGCSDSTTLHVTVNPVYGVPSITVHSAPEVCLHTKYQNFGVDTAAPDGVTYTWSARNATIYATGTPDKFALVNFDSAAGPASVTVTSSAANTCIGVSSQTYYVNVTTSISETRNIIYSHNQFMCLQNDETTYQWGFDDGITLQPVVLVGETNQTYYNTAPDMTYRHYWCTTREANGCTQKSYYNPPVSVTEVNDNVEVKVYPNPASDIVNVDINTTKSGGKIEIEVLDVLGQKINTVTAVDRRAKINVAGLAPGVYLVDTYIDGVKINGTRFIKN